MGWEDYEIVAPPPKAPPSGDEWQGYEIVQQASPQDWQKYEVVEPPPADTQPAPRRFNAEGIEFAQGYEGHLGMSNETAALMRSKSAELERYDRESKIVMAMAKDGRLTGPAAEQWLGELKSKYGLTKLFQQHGTEMRDERYSAPYPVVNTGEEFRKLPSGEKFIRKADGAVLVKPDAKDAPGFDKGLWWESPTEMQYHKIVTDNKVRKAQAEAFEDALGNVPVISDVLSGMAAAGGDFASVVGRITGDDEGADAVNRMVDTFEEGKRNALEGSLPVRQWAAHQIRGAARSVGTMAFGGLGGQSGMVLYASMVAYNQSITKGKDAGLTGEKLQKYALTNGAIEGGVTFLLNKTLGPGLEKAFTRDMASKVLTEGIRKAGISLSKEAGADFLRELPEELIISFSQAVNDKIAGVDQRRYFTKQEAIDTATDVIAQTALMSFGAHFARNAGEYLPERPKFMDRQTFFDRDLSSFRPSRKQMADFAAENPETAKAFGITGKESAQERAQIMADINDANWMDAGRDTLSKRRVGKQAFEEANRKAAAMKAGEVVKIGDRWEGLVDENGGISKVRRAPVALTPEQAVKAMEKDFLARNKARKIDPQKAAEMLRKEFEAKRNKQIFKEGDLEVAAFQKPEDLELATGQLQPWEMSRIEFKRSLLEGQAVNKENVGAALENVYREINRREAAKIGSDDAAQALQYYRDKFGAVVTHPVILGKIKGTTPGGGRVKTVFMTGKDGKRAIKHHVIDVSTVPADTRVATLRHEFEHVMDAEKGLRTTKERFVHFKDFAPEFLQRQLVKEAIASGKTVPGSVLRDFGLEGEARESRPQREAQPQAQVPAPGPAAEVSQEPVGDVRQPAPAAPPDVLKQPKPGLANPGVSEGARGVVNLVDEGRRAAGEPQVRRETEAHAAADETLSDPERRAKLRDDVVSGRKAQLTEDETVAVKRMLNEEADAALKSEDPNKMLEVFRLIESYRETGTEQARAFRQRYDPVRRAERQQRIADLRQQAREARLRGDDAAAQVLDSNAEEEIKSLLKDLTSDRSRNLAEALLAPSKKAQERMDAAKKSGNKKALSEAEAAHFAEVKQVMEGLKLQGIDLKNAQDPIAASDALRAIQATKGDNWDALYEYWQNSILSGPLTNAANISGNALGTMGYVFVDRTMGATVNSVARLFGKGDKSGPSFAEFKYVMSGILPGLAKGFRNALMSWRTEKSWFEISMGREEVLGKYRTGKSVSIAGTKGRLIRALGWRPLGMMDSFAKTLTANAEVGAQAYRIAMELHPELKGEALQDYIASQVDDIHSEAWTRAIAVAKKAAFQGDFEKGSSLEKIENAALAMRSTPGLRYVIPFVGTSMRIFQEGGTRSPYGAFVAAKKVIDASRTGNWSGVAESIGKPLVAFGTLALLHASNDDKDPWLTGNERAYNDPIPPQSIRLGGVWYSYSRLEPIATALSLTVDMSNAMKQAGRGNYDRSASLILQSGVGQFSNKTFLSSLSDIIEASVDIGKEGDTEKLKRWVANFGTSWVPNLVRQPLRQSQEFYNESGVWGKGQEQVNRLINRTLQKIAPGLGGTLGFEPEQMKLDPWGREVRKGPRTDMLWRMIWQNLVPVQRKEHDLFVGDRVIENWNLEHPDRPRTIQPPRRSYTVKGETRYMTDAQYHEFSKASGQLAAKLVELERFDPEHPTEEHLKVIQDARSDAMSLVREKMVKAWAEGKSPEIKVDQFAGELRHKNLALMGEKLSRSVPTKRDKREEYFAQVAELGQLIKNTQVDKLELKQAYSQYLRKNIKTPETRNAKYRRFLSRLNKM